jgi:hypothetical protein
MTLKSLDPNDIPARQRASSAHLTQEEVESAIDMLTNGQAVSPDRSFKSANAARRYGLLIRDAILEAEPEFENGLEPGSKVWEQEKRFYTAVVLRKSRQQKSEQ